MDWNRRHLCSASVETARYTPLLPALPWTIRTSTLPASLDADFGNMHSVSAPLLAWQQNMATSISRQLTNHNALRNDHMLQCTYQRGNSKVVHQFLRRDTGRAPQRQVGWVHAKDGFQPHIIKRSGDLEVPARLLRSRLQPFSGVWRPLYVHVCAVAA